MTATMKFRKFYKEYNAVVILDNKDKCTSFNKKICVKMAAGSAKKAKKIFDIKT